MPETLKGSVIWLVAAGSAVGGVSRYLLGAFIRDRVPGAWPVGTLVINVLGSVLIGFIIRYAEGGGAMSPATRTMLTVGFCGGFTTFSAFSLETAGLLQQGDYPRAFGYAAASVMLCVLGTFAGFSIAGAAR